MRIAQVCHRYHPNIGGVEKHVKAIAERLGEEFEVEVICSDLSPNTKREEVVNGIEVRRFGSISPGNAYFFCPQIYFYLRRRDFDIIHAHNYHAFPAFFAALAKKRSRFIFTPHYHGMSENRIRNLMLKPYKLFGSRIFEAADKIISVSNFERELIMRDFGVQKIDVIPNGVDLTRIKRSVPFDLQDSILYVGRLERYKNIHLIIEAIRYLDHYHLYIIGDGSYKSELIHLIHRLDLESRVKIISNASDDDVYRWMKTCSLFITLSGIEAFGMTVIEALAAGKPVIVNDEAGLSELAEKFEYVLPFKPKEDSIGELAGIIRENAGKKIDVDLHEYDWDNVVTRIKSVYWPILRSKI
jgi:glycosyltransferase involved in cell wall biosynthesis